MKLPVNRKKLMASPEMLHFVQAYIQYGHRVELLAEMFKRQPRTINKWIKSNEFKELYDQEVGKSLDSCIAICEREAPHSLITLVQQRDALREKEETEEGLSINERRLLRDICNDILGYVLGGKIRIEHSGNEDNPVVIKVKGPGGV